MTIALSVVRKYAETLSIGVSWRFFPKSGFGCTWGTEILWIFTKNSRHLLGIYLGGKFGEHRWKIAICRAFYSFCMTDSLTDTQTDCIMCPMLLTHCTDNLPLLCFAVYVETVVSENNVECVYRKECQPFCVLMFYKRRCALRLSTLCIGNLTQCSRIRIFRFFFLFQKNMTFYFFLK